MDNHDTWPLDEAEALQNSQLPGVPEGWGRDGTSMELLLAGLFCSLPKSSSPNEKPGNRPGNRK
jgi:hypothetical protein